MFDIHRVLAMLEVISNQERVDRVHNATYGGTASFQNTLLLLLSRQAVFESSDSNGSIKLPTIVKKYNMLKALWEEILGLGLGLSELNNNLIVYYSNLIVN